MNRFFSFAAFAPAVILASFTTCHSSWALNSCHLERPSEVVSFIQGSLPAEFQGRSSSSDPQLLVRPATDSESLILGVGGSVTLKFTVPIANYPAAGLLSIERPHNALPCSSYPVRAEISGSIDGVHFFPLGTTCESVSLNLGTLPWIAYLRITDITDPTDPAFGTASTSGFDLQATSGPGCLKYSYCAVPAAPDATLTSDQHREALSLSHLGDDFIFDGEASFEEYGNGTARLLTPVHRKSDPETSYILIASFTGRIESPPSDAPVLALEPKAYVSESGTIDPASWYYYKRWSGILLGNGSHADETLEIQGTLNPLQLGSGANGRNASLGASGRFSYTSSSSPAIGDLKIDLKSCSTPEPSPTPQPTPSATPSVVLPTATPSQVLEHEHPTCESKDLTNTLLGLDNMLFNRLDTVNRATRLLVREHRSQRHLRYRSRVRSEIQNLYLFAWRNVWRHERIVNTCAPSTLCFELHLEPTQAAIAASAQTLDTSVENVLRYVGRKLSKRKAKQLLQRLTRTHADRHTSFVADLAKLPHHSAQCRD